MKKLLANQSLHPFVLLALYLLDGAMVIGYWLWKEYCGDPFPADTFAAFYYAIVILVGIFIVIGTGYFVVLAYVKLREYFYSVYEDRNKSGMFSFISLSGSLILVFLYFSGSYLLSELNQDVLFRYENGSKKVTAEYKNYNGNEIEYLRYYFSESGKIEKLEKINRKISVFVSAPSRIEYAEPLLNVIGRDLTAGEHSFAGMDEYPLPVFPETAYDINYSLSLNDFPHLEYSMSADYKIAGNDTSLVRRFNESDDKDGHGNRSRQDFRLMPENYIHVTCEKSVW